MKMLKGKKILITREASQAEQFASLIEKHGGTPIQVPLLNITCRSLREEDPFIKEKYRTFEWIFFTSSHGVTCFFERFGKDISFTHTKFATVGHKTEQSLLKYGYSAAFIPSTYNAEVMAEEFFNEYPAANNILLVRGNISRKLLVEELTKRQLAFDTLVVYDTCHYSSMKERLIEVLSSDDLHYLTFTSPSTVQAFIEMIEDYPRVDEVLQIPAVCIGTTTERTAIDFQFTQTIIPQMFTIESMVETMIDLEITKN